MFGARLGNIILCVCLTFTKVRLFCARDSSSKLGSGLAYRNSSINLDIFSQRHNPSKLVFCSYCLTKMFIKIRLFCARHNQSKLGSAPIIPLFRKRFEKTPCRGHENRPPMSGRFSFFSFDAYRFQNLPCLKASTTSPGVPSFTMPSSIVRSSPMAFITNASAFPCTAMGL